MSKVFVISHDQGVDGGRAIGVFATFAGAENFIVKEVIPKMTSPERLKRVRPECWDSLGDTFTIEEFEVGA